MFWLQLNRPIVRLMFLVLFGISYTALANSPPPAEGGEAAAPKETKKDEYGETQAKVAALEAKIHASEEVIRKLIADKQTTKNQSEVSDIVKNLVAEHKTLQKSIEDYDQARSYLQYRFPEKGLKEKREYERIELKSLEEMESQLSLDSRVKKTLVKVRKQYPGSEVKKKVPGQVMVESHDAVVEDEHHELKPSKKSRQQKQDSPGLADPVILTK